MTAELISVLHVINNCSDGSITRIVERIIRLIGNSEINWHVIGVKGLGELAAPLENTGARVIDFSPKVGDTFPTWKKIQDYINANQIQIVHSHTPRTILEVWRALHFFSRKNKSPVIHIATKHLLTSPLDRRMGLFYALFDRLNLYLPDYLVPVSQMMANAILAQPGIQESHVFVIKNAIPCDDYFRPDKRDTSRLRLGLDPSTIAIGFSGRIMQVKRLDLLIDAFASVHVRFPNIRLIIAGEGNLQPQLERRALQLGVSQEIIWSGFCGDIPGFLSALDIYIQPSINEGLSLSILEAMSAEKPVIATRVGAAEEMIINNVNGILIPPFSSESIQTALLELIIHSEKRNLLARNARRQVLEFYNLSRMVGGYSNLYRKVFELRFHKRTDMDLVRVLKEDKNR